MPDIVSMLQSISNNLPGLWGLVTGGSELMGFWFALRSIYQLKQYGELRTMASTNTELSKPLIFLFVAMALIFWPSLLDMSLISVFSAPNILAYPGSSLGSTADLALSLAGGLIQFIGFISVIRGWVLLTHYGQQQQQSVVGKAIVHIIAGVLAVNVYATWDIFKNTFGI